MKYALLLLLSLACSAMAAPGEMALNPAVTQATIARTICKPGWAATIRPTLYYTNKVKRKLMTAAGIPWSERGKYVLDHDVSLVLGGDPKSPNNLILQSVADGQAKDIVENYLHREVCALRIPLAAAQACIFNRWRSCKPAPRKQV